MRTQEEIQNVLQRIAKQKVNEWPLIDQIKWVKALEDYCDAIEPLMDKNDPMKGWNMMIRRLDEL